MAAVGCSSCPVGFQASRPCSHHIFMVTLEYNHIIVLADILLITKLLGF